MGPFYTYIIFADGVPVYVGKGQNSRCFEHLREKQELEGKQLTIQINWAPCERSALTRERELIQRLSSEGTLLNIRSNCARGTAGRLRKGIHWGPKGRRKLGQKLSSPNEAAQDLRDEADLLLTHPKLGSPSWFADADRWLADHEHYETQFEDWADGYATGFARVMAARRRFERVLAETRAWCEGVSDEEYAFRVSHMTFEHPWLENWVI